MSILEKYNRLKRCYQSVITRCQQKIWKSGFVKLKKNGETLFIPGHHYQKDEVVQFSDAAGDSLQLAQVAASNKKAKYIVFCGVHFMAETADMLTTDDQIVILPDMRAGCSMADMADIEQTERAWKELTKLFGDTMIPLTYVNSTAAIKAFCGRNGGATVTSSNAKQMVSWRLHKKSVSSFTGPTFRKKYSVRLRYPVR